MIAVICDKMWFIAYQRVQIQNSNHIIGFKHHGLVSFSLNLKYILNAAIAIFLFFLGERGNRIGFEFKSTYFKLLSLRF